MPGLPGSFNTEAALMDIEIAIVLLIETRINETVGLTAIDPDNQKNVDRENAKATQEFEDAGNSLAVGRLDIGFHQPTIFNSFGEPCQNHGLDKVSIVGTFSNKRNWNRRGLHKLSASWPARLCLVI